MSDMEGNVRDNSWLRPEEMFLDSRKTDEHFWATRIYDLLNHEMDLQRRNRYEQQRDFRMYEGGEMPYDELAREDPKYQDLRTNFMRVAANYIIAAAQNMEVVGRIYPAGGQFSKEEFRKIAGEYDKRLMAVRQHVDWRTAWDQAIADAIVTGEGWLKEGLRLAENGKFYEFYLHHVDYRNVYVDHTSSMPGLEDASYVFHVKPMDMTRAVARFPSRERLLLDFGYQTRLLHTADSDVAFDIDNPNPSLLYDSLSSREGGGHGNMKVNIGEAFIRTFDMKTDRPVVRVFNFVSDESYSRVVILRQARKWHGHNRFPFTRITPARFRENNLPYSPMTRFRRGYERVMTALMRTAVRMAASRSIIMHAKSATKNSEKSLVAIQQEYKQQLGSPAPVIIDYSDTPGTLKIENLSVDLQKTTSMFEMLMRLSEVQAQVDPSLLGQETNVTAGIAMDQKRDEALNSFPELRTCIRQGVRSLTERILSLCEEHDKAIHYPALIGEDGLPAPVSDGDFTVSGNRVLYHVDLQSGSRTIMREQAANLMAILQKMDPQTSQKFLPMFVEMMRIPDGGHIKNLVVDMLMSSGVSLPMGLLNEEQRKRQEQQQAEAERQRKLQIELAAEDVASQIDLNEAKAVESHAKAMKTLDEIGKEEKKEEKETKAADGGKDSKLIATIRKEMQAVLGQGGQSGAQDAPREGGKKEGVDRD